MSERSYDFDPCSIDGSDQEEETIDTWKPKNHKKAIVQSEWRKNKIGKDFNQMPDLDDLRKIYMFMKKKVSDAEIMQTFGITAETLVSIKEDRYHPVDGIELSHLSKIYKEFDRLEEKIDKVMRGLKYIADIMFVDEEGQQGFKNSLKKPKGEKKKSKSLRFVEGIEEEDDEHDDF